MMSNKTSDQSQNICSVTADNGNYTMPFFGPKTSSGSAKNQAQTWMGFSFTNPNESLTLESCQPPGMGTHFDKHVSHGHKTFLSFLDDPVFRRNCSPMSLTTQPSLLLNIPPPFTSSACPVHFIMPIVFTCCTALMLAGIFLGGSGLVLSISSTFQSPPWYYSRRKRGLFQKYMSEPSKTKPQGGLNFSVAVARASQRGTGKAK